jgi:peptidyl-dipeptidase Dcp
MTNPFLEPSPLPYSLPPYATITDDDFAPAFEAGLAEHRAEVEAVASDPAPATFENTIAALERGGAVLTRVGHVFFDRASSDSNATTDALELELAPRLAAHDDAIRLDPRLYARVRAVADAVERGDDDVAGLDDEQRYLVRRTLRSFERAGAGLGDDEKARLRDLNGRLSTLTTQFEKHLLADTNDLAVVVDDVRQLDGLSDGQVSAAAATSATA